MIDMVIGGYGLRTPIAQTVLSNQLCGNVLSGMGLFGQTHSGAPCGTLGTEIVSIAGGIRTLLRFELFRVLLDSLASVLSSLVAVLQTPFASVRASPFKSSGTPFCASLRNRMRFQPTLGSICLAAWFAPGVKTATELVVTIKVFRSGRVFIAAPCAAFERIVQLSTSLVLSHTLTGKRTGDCEWSLFRSYPRPLHLNYTTDAACTLAAGSNT